MNTSFNAFEVLDSHISGLRSASKTYGGITFNNDACRNISADLAKVRAVLAELVEAATRANGDHVAPDHCYSTGPLTGCAVRDLVECPGCVLSDLLARVGQQR